MSKVMSFHAERSIKLFSKSACAEAFAMSHGGESDEKIADHFCTSVKEARGMIDAGHELDEA